MLIPEKSQRSSNAIEPVETTALIIGASGGIGLSLFEGWKKNPGIDHIVGISRLRNPDHVTGETYMLEDGKQVDWIQSDYTEADIRTICSDESITERTITRVCICNGILHNGSLWPEKRLEDLSVDDLIDQYRINTLLPMLWLKHLLPTLKRSHQCVVSVFSARVGSISDNRLGGWYGYRSSKAALNMMLKTASVEFGRRAKHIKLIAFHPGTTDTSLSRPFLDNVSHEILDADTVASSLIDIMNNSESDNTLDYIDWENRSIEF